MEPVRWGIVSTARINRAVIPGLRESPASELVAVASRDAGRAEAYAREHLIPRAQVGIELRRDDDLERIEVENPDRYRLQGDNVSRSIRGLERPLLGREDALAQARTIAALYRSAQRDGAPAGVV